MAIKETAISPYLADFARLERQRWRDEDAWLRDLRRRAIDSFAGLGFPSTDLEEWKHTNVAALVRSRFQPSEPTADTRDVEIRDASSLADGVLNQSRCRVVFANGRYNRKLSASDSPAGVSISSIADGLRIRVPALRAELGRHASIFRSAFVALNTAFLEDGALIEIADGAILEDPIYLLFASTAAKAIASYPRTLIVAGRHSQAKIIEVYVGKSDGAYFTDAVTEIVAGEDSIVEHYKLQNESERAFHIASLQVYQAEASNFVSHSVSFGGGLARNDVGVQLGGEGAECALNGLYVTAASQHIDSHTVIDHAKPRCQSRELYKGILEDKSTAVFNGSIVVRKDAQKTDAIQSNKNLLLSREATINSKPQLEINADDVKCAHGTSIGHLDEDAVFYLRSRGVAYENARVLLTYGFANDVLMRMKHAPLRASIERELLARLSTTPPGERERRET